MLPFSMKPKGHDQAINSRVVGLHIKPVFALPTFEDVKCRPSRERQSLLPLIVCRLVNVICMLIALPSHSFSSTAYSLHWLLKQGDVDIGNQLVVCYIECGLVERKENIL